MIRSNLSPPPSFPATFWDFVPFVCAGVLALVFTALLVLLVEDDSNDGTNKALVQQTAFVQHASYDRRIVGHSEKEREWTTARPTAYSHEYGHHAYAPMPVHYREKRPASLVSGSTGTASTPGMHPRTPVFSKRLLATLPPSPTSPTPSAAPIAAPMLSMAKLIMYRHDQANRRARQARAQRQTQSPPQVPPRTQLRL